jgi:hypothetical protein
MLGTAKNKRDAVLSSAVIDRMVIKSIAGVGPEASVIHMSAVGPLASSAALQRYVRNRRVISIGRRNTLS